MKPRPGNYVDPFAPTAEEERQQAETYQRLREICATLWELSFQIEPLGHEIGAAAEAWGEDKINNTGECDLAAQAYAMDSQIRAVCRSLREYLDERNPESKQ